VRRIAILLVASVGFAASAWGHTTFRARVQPPSSEPATSAFVGVTVVPMDAQRVLPNQIVLVRGERILEVGDADSIVVPRRAKRIDGRGLFLLPGLADMHVHLLEAKAYFPLFLANGVTTVRHMATPPDVRALRGQVKCGAIIGPTIYTAGPILDGSPPVWSGSDVVTTRDEAERVIAQQKRDGYDFLKIYDNLLPPAYEAIADAAVRVHMNIAGHVPPHVGLKRVLDAHQKSIEHLTGYFEWLQKAESPFIQGDEQEVFAHPAHMLAKRQGLANWVAESRIPQIAAATAKAGTWNVPTLVAWRNMTPSAERDAAWKRPGMSYATPMLRKWWNSDTGYTANDWAAKRHGDAVRFEIVKALHDAGARLLVGTDTPHPFVIPGFSVHQELANFVNAGLSPYEALKAATVDAAEFMDASGEFGVIRTGARADLLLVEANPLEDVRNASRIVGVMVRGHWLSRETLQRELDAR
jgi:cytosine/adenosine deaminase-related metal-dependent hydrolase